MHLQCMQLPAVVSVGTSSQGFDVLGQLGPIRQALQAYTGLTGTVYIPTSMLSVNTHTQVPKDLYTTDGNSRHVEGHLQFLRHVRAYRETSILTMVSRGTQTDSCANSPGSQAVASTISENGSLTKHPLRCFGRCCLHRYDCILDLNMHSRSST